MLWSKVYTPTGYNNGYPVFWDKDHPLATTDGRVFMHRHVASIKLGRWITADEIVHHIDENKDNFLPDNLLICSRSEHTKIHKTTEVITSICKLCGCQYEITKDKDTYCSIACSQKGSIKDPSITKEILQPIIDSGLSWVKIGKMFNYSDVGIKKRAIKLGCKISR